MNRLRTVLGFTQIAVVPDMGDKTGHCDEMVSFIDTNVVAVSGSLPTRVLDAVMLAMHDAFGETVRAVVLDSKYKVR